jgi:transposase
MPRVELTGEECERLYRQGMSLYEIADLYGVHFSTVYRRLVERGTPLRKHKNKPGPDYSHPNRKTDAEARAQHMAELYRGGFTLKEVGNIYDLSMERVRQILNELEPGMTKRARKAQPEPAPAPAPLDEQPLLSARAVLANPANHPVDVVLDAARRVGAAVVGGG